MNAFSSVSLRYWLLAAIAAPCITVAAVAVFRFASPSPARNQAPPLEGSLHTEKAGFADPFLNTRPEVQYVGAEACAACHAEEHESFRHTGMGRSMAEVDLDREPPDALFEHPPSGRRYEVQRRGGRMWHREWLASPTEEVLLQEHPVTYVTGSGRHSLTYVVETEDGFFVESPITWYASKQAWGMSPGYDRAEHSSFRREVGQECLICHAGRVEAIENSYHRLRVIEATIGCERCHGPGELHVEKHGGRSAKRRESDPGNADSPDSSGRAFAYDETIVNPARLPRELAEAVCHQCHLKLSATVLLSGKRLDDFRPGLPLASFRMDYTHAAADNSMTVVGHVEQMHRSACYRESSSFTCSTCHNPHGEPQPEERTAHYKSICLKCHQVEHCGVAPERRARESPANDCVACHMPTTPTDIPHIAFTHHRVGIHEAPSSAIAAASPTRGAAPLRPYFEDAHLPQAEKERALGLAYFDLATHERDPALRRQYQETARNILLAAENGREIDGAALAALASLEFDLGLGEHGRLAQRALADPQLHGLSRANALFLRADSQFEAGRYQEALELLDTLSRLRRHSLQWLLRAECEKRLANGAGVSAALREAVAIDPSLSAAHRHLAEIYLGQGEKERAAWHAARAKAP